jgi:hypothetical protein
MSRFSTIDTTLADEPDGSTLTPAELRVFRRHVRQDVPRAFQQMGLHEASREYMAAVAAALVRAQGLDFAASLIRSYADDLDERAHLEAQRAEVADHDGPAQW